MSRWASEQELVFYADVIYTLKPEPDATGSSSSTSPTANVYFYLSAHVHTANDPDISSFPPSSPSSAALPPASR